jgi:hypothetical protein
MTKIKITAVNLSHRIPDAVFVTHSQKLVKAKTFWILPLDIPTGL